MDVGAVVFSSRKYGGAVHRTWRTFGPLPAYGFLLFGYRETEMLYPQTGERVRFEELGLHILQPGVGRMVTMWFGPSLELAGIYVDVCLPPTFDRAAMTVDFIDLDLDVRVRTERQQFTPEILDQDEFELNAQELAYPPALRASAKGSLGSVLADLRARRPPFDLPAGEWLSLLRRLLDAADGVAR